MTKRKRKQKASISIIGSGRLGTTLGVALLHHGYSVQSLVAGRVQTARKAARLLDANIQVLAAKELHSLLPADVRSNPERHKGNEPA